MKETYEEFLKLLNLTEEQFLNEINKHPVFYCYKDIITIKKSTIQGVGCFTTKSYKADEVIGNCLYGSYKTELGRYVNHSNKPNIYLKKGKFIALKELLPAEELLVNYFTNLKTLKKENLI
jgi:SET domain-containing protein